MSLRSRFYIFPTVFVTGAGVMILELLGTRIISPYYGSGLYVWSSLITVALVSLSLGYWVGGSLADRVPRPNLLYFLIFVSGVTEVLIPLIAPPVLKVSSSLGLGLGAVCSSFILFTVPLLLLAMVTPYAVRLQTRELTSVGVTAGRLYAVSTMGSFVGTILTGFVLIPNMGVRSISWVLGTALFLVSAIYFLGVRKLAIGSLSLLLAIFAIAIHPEHELEEGVVHREESLYGQLKVIDLEDDRYLLVDGAPQTVVDKPSGVSLLKYTHYVEVLHLYNPGAESMLLIGLGGGSIAEGFRKYALRIDIVEIDPRMVAVAQRFFGFTPDQGEVHIGDGRYYIQHSPRTYDFIVIDAFSGDAAPFHLYTRQLFSNIDSILSPEGILVINVVGAPEGDLSPAAKAIWRTVSAVFPQVEVYSTTGGDELGNLLLFASNRELRLAKDVKACEDPITRRALTDMLSRRVGFPEGEGIVITDDYNPTEILSVRAGQAWRMAVLEVFSPQQLFD